MVTVVYNISAR